MEMEKRFILAMILSMLVVVLYRYMVVPTPPPPAPQNPPAPATSGTAAGTSGLNRVEPSTQADRVSEVADQEPATQAGRQTITIQDSRYQIILSNQGGIVTSWKFFERKGYDVELVHQGNPPGAFGPLALWCTDARIFERLNSVNYAIESPDISDAATPAITLKTPTEITFSYRGSGLHATKTLRFLPSTFCIEISAEVTAQGQPVPLQVQVGPGLGATDQALGSDTRHLQKVAILSGSSVERIEFKEVENLQQRTGIIQWAGVESQYFASLVLPSSGRAFTASQIRPFAFKDKDQEVFLAAVDAPISPDEKLRLFFGPKEQSVLRSTHPSLVQVIDFGWLGVVVEYLLLVLNWIYGWVRNYGWAIIILTFLITLALFPLRYKQMVAMKKMQKLQPQLKAIQERYKKAKKSAEDRQKMNMETMALYKEHGVNPLGGCLPLLLQMPILFAFYSMLANSFELRGAPFMFWIQDLSAQDPYYITPLLMGVTMLISMKMTPTTTTDPMQSKMMMIMPVMMTFMFLTLSAGLNLYFLFSNVFSIAMQKVSERFLPAMKAA